MLNQLIESKTHRTENTRKNGILLSTLGVLVAVLMSGWTYSLFAKSFGMGAGDIEFSNLVAPVPAVQPEDPPKPEPPPSPERRQTSSSSEQTMVKEKVALIENSLDKPPRLDESRKLESAPLRPDQALNVIEGSENRGRQPSDQNQSGNGIDPRATSKTDEEIDRIPEVVKPTPKPEEPKEVVKPKVIQTLGVVNGRATYLAKPSYPATAKALQLSGSVSVQVTIDENGNVVSASAVSGHVFFRRISETAARQSKFSPTYLSKQAVKVTGVIVYQFKP